MNRLKEKTNKSFDVWSSLIISLLANLPIMDIAVKRKNDIPFEHSPHVDFNPIGLFADMFIQLVLSFLFAYLLISFLQKNKWTTDLYSRSFWKTSLITILLYFLFGNYTWNIDIDCFVISKQLH